MPPALPPDTLQDLMALRQKLCAAAPKGGERGKLVHEFAHLRGCKPHLAWRAHCWRRRFRHRCLYDVVLLINGKRPQCGNFMQKSQGAEPPHGKLAQQAWHAVQLGHASAVADEFVAFLAQEHVHDLAAALRPDAGDDAFNTDGKIWRLFHGCGSPRGCTLGVSARGLLYVENPPLGGGFRKA